jgi:uncharacterized membrane protein
MNEASSDLMLFLGRFHPLLVHLPIGFLVLLATLELLALRPPFKAANGSARFILALAVPAAAATAFCGWLLGQSGEYEPSLLEWHERAGIGVAIAYAILLLLHGLNQKRAYRVCLVLSCGLLAVASHLGGSLTHGRDYLTRYAPEPFRSWLGGTQEASATPSTSATAGWAQQKAFGAVVQPILQQYCVPCHGPEKSKARLRLDSFDGLQRGSKDGPVVRAGASASSRLIELMALPEEDDSHMPPLGKPQPGTDDLALIRWWIDAGASATATAGELKPPAEIEQMLKARFP